MSHYPRQFRAIPPVEQVGERIAELFGEAERIDARRADAVRERNRLASVLAEQEANEADARAASAAIREGKSLASVGTPAMDQLAADRKRLDQEIDACVTTLKTVEDELEAEFQKLMTDDATSGRRALDAAEKRYRTAITSLAKARADFLAARGLHRYIASAAGAPSYSFGTAWPPADPGIPICNLSRTGERDYNLRPVSLEHLIEHALLPDLEAKP